LPITILVVDDDRDLLDLVESNLKEQNPEFDIVSAVSAQDGLRFLEESPIDAVVCDYHLGPDQMNGVELLAWLRRSGNNMPFIIFTGHSREDVAIKALNLGADFYMKKEEEDYQSLFTELAHHISTTVEGRKFEKALAESEARFRHMFESSLDGIVALDSDGCIMKVNNAFCEIIGMSIGELEGIEFRSLVPESWHEQDKYIETMLAETGYVRLFEEELRAKDGRLVNVALSRWKMGPPDEASSWIIVRDITSRKDTEKRLQRSEEMFRSVFRDSPVALSIFNSDGELIDANRTTLKIFGVESIEAILGYSLFLDPDFPDEAKTALKEGRKYTLTRDYNFEAVRERGQYETSRAGLVKLLIHAAPFGMDDTGSASGYVLQMQDVTEDFKPK
jgi:PAS domain S-box-containing protein